MEFLTVIFLIFLFIAIYFFSLNILISIHNKEKLFYSPKSKKKYSISFLVPAFNEEKTIKDTIEHIFKIEYPIKEVIVINDGSTDDTAKIVRSLMKNYSKLKLLNKKNEGRKAYAINYGLKEAKGELIAITDSDSYPSPDSVEKMIGFFDEDKVAAVTSCVFLKNKNKFFEKIQEIEYVILAWTRKLLDFLDSVYVTNGPLSIYKRSVLLEVGGFDTNSVTEDIEITWHILSKGYKTRMSLGSTVYTTAPNKFGDWWRQRVRWGVGGIQTIFKYKKSFLKQGIFGFFIIPFVSISIILSILGFLFTTYLLIKNFFLNVLSAGYSISLKTSLITVNNINTHPSIILIIVFILFVLSFFYSSYVFREMEQKHIVKFSKVFNRLFYMFIYLTLYPIVWFDAIYKMVRKEYKW